jgi:DNA polymerase
MRDSYHDTETFSRTPIKDGSFKYAEDAEVMIWSFALEDGQIYVWDRVNDNVHWQDDFSGAWQEAASYYEVPEPLQAILDDQQNLVWFQNGGMFDFPVLDNNLPDLAKLIPLERRRDTMVQFFAHGLPGALDKIGAVLKLESEYMKLVRGKKLIQLFCKPQNENFVEKYGTDRATKATHPSEWQEFIEYAAQDIVVMRAAHKRVPMWNYRDKQVKLCHLDWIINARGFQIDMDLVRAAISNSDREKAKLARRTNDLTNGEVSSATKRDALMSYIAASWGVTLPDMLADTLERRMDDPDLPDALRELLGVRLASSINSVTKYKRLLRATNTDGRLRGGAQFRGAGRTGRWAHRLFQHGNLPRPKKEYKPLMNAGIEALKLDCADIVVPDVLDFCRSAVRGAIIAKPGHKLIVADLANIEGRMAAWVAGEHWKLQAFKDYDTILGYDEKGKEIRKGLDLYIKAFMASFNITDPKLVGPDDRQIGKVEELMFQYGGGVGAWLTGAATYGIDLDAMTDAVWGTIPQWAKDQAIKYLRNLYEPLWQRYDNRVKKKGMSPSESDAIYQRDCEKARLGLDERTWVTCDAIKRLWREAHPEISSYWNGNDERPGLETCFRRAINNPGITIECRRVKIRRDGVWIRVALPSGRVLCYLNPKIEDDNRITCAGFNQYTRKWERISTYGGKLFENIIQAAACDQLSDAMLLIEENNYPIVFHVHDEPVVEVPDTGDYTVEAVCEMLTADFGWNRGCPLAAAGFETDRYRKD